MTDGGDLYIPRSCFDGSLTLKMLRLALRERGISPINTAHLLQDLVRASDIRTEPKLPVPTEIRLNEDETFSIITPKQTYTEEDVRVFYDQPSPFRRGKGDHFDWYDWEAARIDLYNRRLRYMAEHGHEPPRRSWPVKKTRDFFAQRGEYPGERSVRRHVAKWYGRRGP
jgi:hypothetical protein